MDGSETFFVTMDGDRRVALYVNEDGDLLAECLGRFGFELKVDGRDDAERRRYARMLFDKLALLGTVELLLADEQIDELARFEPKTAAEERWTDDGYILILRSLPDGTFELFDPQTGKVDSVWKTRDEAVNELRDDEYTRKSDED